MDEKIRNTGAGGCVLDRSLAAGQYVAWTGDPFGISCFCYKETGRADRDLRFLEVCRIQLWKNCTRIFARAGDRLYPGCGRVAVFLRGGPLWSADHGDQVDTGGFLYYFVSDLDTIQKSVGIYLLSDGASGGVHEYSAGNPPDRQEAFGNGGYIWRRNGQTDLLYLHFPDSALSSNSLYTGTRALLEGGSCGGGDRCALRLDRRKTVSCESLSEYTGSVCLDDRDHCNQLSI